MVKNYVLRYDPDQDRPWLIFQYQVDGNWKNVNWFPPNEDAVYLSVMLSNEKPICYVENRIGKKWLTTSSEEIGEEEF